VMWEGRAETAVRALYSELQSRVAGVQSLTPWDASYAEHEVGSYLRENPSWAGSLSEQEMEWVRRRLVSEICGLGPLDCLMSDEEVTDIMVNRHDEVWVCRGGRTERTPVRFWDDGHVRRIVERIATWARRRIDEGNPILDARLPDGSRAHAVLHPVAVYGTALTVRRFPRRRMPFEDLVTRGTLSEDMAEVFRVLVEDHANIVICGAPGSGKTTLLNAICSLIPPHERVVTIEDTAELELTLPNWVRLESQSTGAGREVTMRDLLRAALRMRPDRVIVGEVRGPEAADMLQAMHAGHRGSYSTLHASGCRNALSRLEVLVMQGGADYTVRAIREMISQSVDVVVWMQLLPDGRRVVGQVDEVTGMEGDVIQLQPLWRYSAARRRHEWSGIVPTIWQKLREEHSLPPVFERMAGRQARAFSGI
jgi:pilus assembly protein CpaF